MAKVLLVGWDAADWKVINPLMDAGMMPSLQSLIENGVMGRLATLDPPLSPMLWTSIATGKRPYKHGIHGFTEPIPGGRGIRPIYNTSRKCKAIWNILTQSGRRSHVVGWWPSHPAEPINGTMISNFFPHAQKKGGDSWVMPNGTVHPADQVEFFSKLRVHIDEITSAHIEPFVKDFEKVDQLNDRALDIIAQNIASTASMNCAATYLMEHSEWDFLAVYFDAIDHFSHAFMKYHPPKRDHISIQEYELYKDVVSSGYRFHDMMLGRYLELVDDETTIVLVSDHGFHPGERRPASLPNEPTGPAVEHSPFGIIAMKGPGVKKDELVFGASLLDVTPTLLHIFGLPVGRDMDGKILITAFENENALDPVNSWESIDGDDGRHPSDKIVSAEEMDAELRQLIDLGYIEDPGDNAELAAKNAVDENNYNLARAFFNGQRWDDGIRLLEMLHDENPKVLRYATYLANGYLYVGKFGKARRVVNDIRTVLDRESAQVDMLEGTLLLAEERPAKALELFTKVEGEAGEQPQLRLKLANSYFQLHRYEKALSLLERALEEDDEEVGAWYLSGLCYYHVAEYDHALEYLLHAIGLQYYQPVAHFYLGETLFAMERYEEAATAFNVCLRIAPTMNYARKRLISIYESFLDQPENAAKYRSQFDGAYKGELTIVSGLPRSGTSMMMQMLSAGGIELFIDGTREPDENNKKGYFEHEAVKNLAVNKSWVSQAAGMGVKVIAQLLPKLPLNYRYKVICMERDMSEVVRSQQKMLRRMGKMTGSGGSADDLERRFEDTILTVKEWMSAQHNFEVLSVNYDDVLADPESVASRVNAFLGGTLEESKMSDAVDAGLRREGAANA